MSEKYINVPTVFVPTKCFMQFCMQACTHSSSCIAILHLVHEYNPSRIFTDAFLVVPGHDLMVRLEEDHYPNIFCTLLL